MITSHYGENLNAFQVEEPDLPQGFEVIKQEDLEFLFVCHAHEFRDSLFIIIRENPLAWLWKFYNATPLYVSSDYQLWLEIAFSQIKFLSCWFFEMLLITIIVQPPSAFDVFHSLQCKVHVSDNSV